MEINQVNISYAPLEDRILMRINTLDGAEFRIWLTRTVVSRMLQGLTQSERQLFAGEVPAMINPLARESVQQFQQDASAAEADYSTQFASKANSFPLGEQPVLVAKLEIRNENGHSGLAFTLLTNQIITINLNPILLSGVNKLLCDVVKGLDWNLPFFGSNRPIIRMAESSMLH